MTTSTFTSSPPSPYAQVDTPSAATSIWQVWHTVSADHAVTSAHTTAIPHSILTHHTATVTTTLPLSPPDNTPVSVPDAISVLSTVLLVVGVMALLLAAVAAVWEAWLAHKTRQQRQVMARKRRIAQDAAALHSVLAAQAFRVHQEMVREAVRHQRR